MNYSEIPNSWSPRLRSGVGLNELLYGENNYGVRDMNPLIGKTITGLMLSKDNEAIKFQTTDGDIVAFCDGDCCSTTWIEAIENTVREFPALVTAAGEIEGGLPKPIEDDPEHDYLQFYGFKVTTDKGVIVIDYRNSSNGYYGGSLDWPGAYGYNRRAVGQDDWKAAI